MSFILWRIGADTPDYDSDDLSGKGAEKSGGRWNRAGVPMVYTSTSRALACLETIVHLAKKTLPLNRYLVEIAVPDSAWGVAGEVDPATLVGWDAEPAGRISLNHGTDWIGRGKAGLATAPLLLKVPSVVVPEEWNVLINPLHPDIGTVKARKVRKWVYDGRLVA